MQIILSNIWTLFAISISYNGNSYTTCMYGERERERCAWYNSYFGGARGVMVIIVGNGHGDMSSNPGWDWLHFI